MFKIVKQNKWNKQKFKLKSDLLWYKLIIFNVRMQQKSYPSIKALFSMTGKLLFNCDRVILNQILIYALFAIFI